MSKGLRECRTASALLCALACCALLAGQDIAPIAAALRAHDFPTALNLSRQALATAPSDHKLWTLEGLALSGLRDNVEALKAFQHALTLSPNYLPAVEGKAQLEFTTHNPAAKATLHHVLALHPDDPVAHAMLGALSYEGKDCASAAQHYGRSEQFIHSNPVALKQYARCLLQLDRAKEAATVLQELVTSNPQDGTARYNLASAQLAAHLPQEALTTLTALKDSPVPPGRVAEISSSAYEMLGNTPQAVEALRAAILRNPKDEDLYISFASLCLDHRSYDVAVKFLNAGMQVIPNSYRLHVTRGILCVQLGNYDDAARDFDLANRLDPSHSFGFVAQGLSQMQQSKLEQALATTEAEIKRNPSDAFLYYLKAETLRRQGAGPGTPVFREALQAASRAVALKPHFPVAQDLLGFLYLKSEKFDEAAKAFQSALNDDPTDQSALYHMLTVARRTGQTNLIPDLVKRLAEAKQEAQKRDVQASKYRIMESTNAVTTQP